MKITNDVLIEWIGEVSRVKGLQMDPEALADDIFLMAYVYQNPIEFDMAMQNVIKAFDLIIKNSVNTSQLAHHYTDWQSYHFQSKRTQGQKADLRIIFKKESDVMYVRGFGNRWIPADIYYRLRHRGIDG
ncbi:hypothetical protein [Lentibacillus sp. CBA3610]|uniref:hypothetical protein n=1 Tax=Lentibacillus sp. CBA3610 TaxID=2518176 RepID=UPI001595CC17|nr:hypothetical protein [Lentibacillus sp. CBA3610]QKY70443.1 hypothetical protein Len3610_13335 [Lentibacillus sp. CBA3610]